MTALRERDPNDVRLASLAPEPLRAFNDAGVLSSADVQVARRLAMLADVDDPAVLLALALAVRAPRLGHVLVDLATIRETVAVDTEEAVDVRGLDWPAADDWVARVAACTLISDPPHPLRLDNARLYLDRYWREEDEVAKRLRTLADASLGGDDSKLAGDAERLYPDGRDVQVRAAVLAAGQQRLTVIAGGPGTGKTTAVARITAVLADQKGTSGPTVARPLIALAAPTGKAAARLGEAVHDHATRADIDPDTRAALLAIRPKTLHRLLGSRPGSRGRFRHDQFNRLPHDVVIVDEASMVSLTMMARLLEALRDDARLVLVGDPNQLASIEAGAVLGDIVGAATTRGDPRGAAEIADRVIMLDRVHRFGGGIAAVADAVRSGDADRTVTALRAANNDVVWLDGDEGAMSDAALAPVREVATAAGREVFAAAREGDAARALAALGEFRMLCAHRRGPHGVTTWMPLIERWLAAEVDTAGGRIRDYPGRPLLITANDYDLNLFNGETGVVIADSEGRLLAAFEQRGGVTTVRPNQLGAVETVYAMTVHKSQGSQFATAAVVLPPPESRILTRELLYTAVTRARQRLIIVGTEEAIRAAVARPAARASGLRDRLSASG